MRRNTYFYLILSIILFSACTNLKKLTDSNLSSRYTIEYLSDNEYYYEGANLIVELFDQNGYSLTDAIVSLSNENEGNSSVELGESAMLVDYVTEKTRISITKPGYVSIETDYVEMRPNMGCFVKFYLINNSVEK